MEDRAALLARLRIDREAVVVLRRRERVAPLVAAVVAVAAILWLWLAPAEDAPTAVAAAAPVAATTAAPAGPPAGGSILDASGYVVARRQATVSSKITGKVVAVLVEEGQRVEAGQVIARLDDTNAQAHVAQAAAQVEQQRATLNAARVAFDNEGPTFDRHRQQFAGAFVSAQAFDTAKASYDAARTNLDVVARALDVAEANLALTQRNLDDTVVRAPFAGVVTVKAAQEGEMVSPVSAGGGFTRTGIGTIVDMDSLEVEVDVSETFINRVRREQNATITLNAYPEEKLDGRVIAIIPTADRAKATVKVRVGFEQKDARILPEMGARVAFLDDAQ